MSRSLPPFFPPLVLWFQVFHSNLIHFNFLYDVRQQSFHSFLCGCPVSPTLFIEDTVPSPLYNLGSFVIKLIGHICVGFCSVPLIYVSIFMPIPFCLDYYRFKIRKCDASSFVLSQYFFGYLSSLWSHTNFRFVLFLWKMPWEF